LKKTKFNEYEIIDNIVLFKVTCKDKELYTIIDLKNLQRLIDLNITWSASDKIKAKGGFYIQGNIRINGKKETICLHTFLLNCIGVRGIYHIDHKNNNPLDNRENNLRKVTISQNMQNRKGKNSNNITGYRNVCFSKGWYVVQIQVDGKNKRLGKFKDVIEAGKFAEEMRQKYYGDFAGKS